LLEIVPISLTRRSWKLFVGRVELLDKAKLDRPLRLDFLRFEDAHLS
jgi:hypothetical protein